MACCKKKDIQIKKEEKSDSDVIKRNLLITSNSLKITKSQIIDDETALISDYDKSSVFDKPIKDSKIEHDSVKSITSFSVEKRGKRPTPDELIYDYYNEILRRCRLDCVIRKNLNNDLIDKYKFEETPSKVYFCNILELKAKFPKLKAPYSLDMYCYDVYSEFFEPIITDLQCNMDKHIFCQAPSYGLSENFYDFDLNSEEENLRVVFCEITVRRNLNEYPLNGVSTKKEKQAVKELIKEIFSDIFSSLTAITIPKEWKHRLNETQSVLEDTNFAVDHANTRFNMAFCDDEGAALGVLINYDDHLQIVSSINNGKIGHVFHEMNKIVNSTDLSSMEYLLHPRYGFLTVNPMYLGTGFTIRLHVKLPYVILLDDAEDIYLRDLNLHMFQKNYGYEKEITILSNKCTMNLREEEIYNNIIEGYHRLIELDAELKFTCASAVEDETMPVESLTKLYHRINSCEIDICNNYTKKYFTDIMAAQLNGVTTGFNGLINHCIRSNAFYPISLFPKACDPDCYSTFNRFFNPILLECNSSRQFNHSIRPNYFIKAPDYRFKFIHDLILKYRVRFSRNFENFAFPMLLTTFERMTIENKMIKSFKEMPDYLKGDYYKLEELEENNDLEIIKILRSLNLIPLPFNKVKKCCNVYKDWPKHRGVFIASDSDDFPNNVLAVIVNEDDHFQVISINYYGERLDLCYTRAVICLKYFEDFFENKFSQKQGYGYLSANPQNVGCCMRVSCVMLLKNLNKRREIFQQICRDNNLNYRGMKGSGTSGRTQGIYDISWRQNLNISEQLAVTLFCQRVKTIIRHESNYDPLIHLVQCIKSDQLDHDTEKIVSNLTEQNNLEIMTKPSADINKEDSEYIEVDMNSVTSKSREILFYEWHMVPESEISDKKEFSKKKDFSDKKNFSDKKEYSENKIKRYSTEPSEQKGYIDINKKVHSDHNEFLENKEKTDNKKTDNSSAKDYKFENSLDMEKQLSNQKFNSKKNSINLQTDNINRIEDKTGSSSRPSYKKISVSDSSKSKGNSFSKPVEISNQHINVESLDSRLINY